MSNPREAAQQALECKRLADNYAGACAGCDPGEFATKERDALYMAIDKLNALAQPDDKAQQVVPDFDAFVDCDECSGDGFRDVERQVSERKSDVQTFREECESCGGSGKEYKGRPLYATPQPPAKQGEELSDEQILEVPCGTNNGSQKWLLKFARAVIEADRAERGGEA